MAGARFPQKPRWVSMGHHAAIERGRPLPRRGSALRARARTSACASASAADGAGREHAGVGDGSGDCGCGPRGWRRGRGRLGACDASRFAGASTARNSSRRRVGPHVRGHFFSQRDRVHEARLLGPNLPAALATGARHSAPLTAQILQWSGRGRWLAHWRRRRCRPTSLPKLQRCGHLGGRGRLAARACSRTTG